RPAPPEVIPPPGLEPADSGAGHAPTTLSAAAVIANSRRQRPIARLRQPYSGVVLARPRISAITAAPGSPTRARAAPPRFAAREYWRTSRSTASGAHLYTSTQ